MRTSGLERTHFFRPALILQSSATPWEFISSFYGAFLFFLDLTHKCCAYHSENTVIPLRSRLWFRALGLYLALHRTAACLLQNLTNEAQNGLQSQAISQKRHRYIKHTYRDSCFVKNSVSKEVSQGWGHGRSHGMEFPVLSPDFIQCRSWIN